MELVEERTSELQKSNEELGQEISERRKVEDALIINYKSLQAANELLENVFSNVHVLIAYNNIFAHHIRQMGTPHVGPHLMYLTIITIVYLND